MQVVAQHIQVEHVFTLIMVWIDTWLKRKASSTSLQKLKKAFAMLKNI